MDTPVTTRYRTTSRKCLRCNGGGIYQNIGICFRCGGCGREFEAYESPMTEAELAAAAEYQAGIDAREARAVARAARRAAREAV
jgi:hypothetical protein